MSVIKIEEFSRKFYETQKNGKFVSGGFDREVGLGNKIVPEKIQQAVNEGYFRINDSYAPEGEEFALVAREIDEYSVLAVARSILEDGGRPVVAYRYFWLEKHQNEDIDGIGTLLIWWEKVGTPKFQFNWHPKQLEFYCADTYSCDDVLKAFNSEKQQPPKIDKIPFLLLIQRNGELKVANYKWLHYCALYLNNIYSNASIAWAWNVRALDKIETFTLIYLADSKAYANTLPYKSQLIPKRNSETNQKQSQTQQDVDWQAIKNCLSSAMKNDGNPNEIKLAELVAYLEKNPSSEWNWDCIIDKNIINNSTTPSGASYKALLAILGYIKVQDWLDWLRKKNNQTFQENSLTIQAVLLQTSDREDKKVAYQRLLFRINEDMIELMQQKNLKNNQGENIEWLLFDSHSLLSPDLVNYSWPSYYQKFFMQSKRHSTTNLTNSNQTKNRRKTRKYEYLLVLIGVLLGIILTATASLIVGKFSILFFNKNSVLGANDFSYASTFDRELYLWKKTGDKEAKDKINKFLAETDEEKNKPTDMAIKNSFTTTISLSKEPTSDNPIKSGSSPEDINIIQQILKSLKYQSDASEISFYEGEITGKFDDTVPAINKFQSLEMQLAPTTGVVASKTWQALKESFRDEQVKVAKQLLLKSFQKRENDDDIKKDIKNLQICQKKEAIEYIDCVQKLSKDIPDKP
ncbi:peptidoglycan-binding domain-containing protein [Aerosakkonema funiforme]|uniref:peptidoglycan-binding domain-containing protein n=1 Tax=Aerosakkonema funiforme TaxID=1246630 RepID=UPI0035BAA999